MKARLTNLPPGLSPDRILELSSGDGVDPVPVTNFLSSLSGLSLQEALSNCELDSASFGWGRETSAAIRSGVLESFHGRPGR